MPNSNLYYVIYDISSNKTRNDVILRLKAEGLSRIQKSVFCGTLNQQQLKDLKDSLKPMIEETDRLYIIMSCEACFGKIITLGEGFDEEYVTGKKKLEWI